MRKILWLLFPLFFSLNCGSGPHWDLNEPIYVEYDPNRDMVNISDSDGFIEGLENALIRLGGKVSKIPTKQTIHLSNSSIAPCSPEFFIGGNVAAFTRSPQGAITVCYSPDSWSRYDQKTRNVMMLHEAIHLLSGRSDHLRNILAIMYPSTDVRVRWVLTPDDVAYLCSTGNVENGSCYIPPIVTSANIQ